MPTLFTSYKRDDKVAVTKITDRLRKEFYFDIWIDAVNIPGGEDWRAEIRKGIDKAEVVLLMLTPDACASPQVKEEIDYAKSVGRKILPLQLKRVSSDDLEKLGVEHLNYIDFVASHDDRAAWEKLLTDLPEVLERDKRLLNPEFRALHQEYLRSLFTRYGKLSLSYLLDATPRERVGLFEVYVPLKLGVSFNVEAVAGEMVDWWMRDQDADERAEMADDAARGTPKPKALNGFAPGGAAWPAWESRMRDAWAEFKAKHEEEQAKKDEKDREPLKDGTYYWYRIESEVAPALMPRIVITGAPGSGKSTLLKHLALCMAGDMLAEGDEAEADLNSLGFWPLPAYTPVFVELRALVRTAFPDPGEAVTLEKFFAYLEAEQLRPHGISRYLDDLRAQLRDGDAMLFLDGLDEVPDADTPERREQIRTLAHLLSTQYPACRICITSRPYAYAGDWQLDGFGQARLTTLDPDRLAELALRLFRVVLGQEGAEQEAESFKAQMKNVPDALRGSPLFFTLMAAIWLNNLTRPASQRLPVATGDIYRACIEMLIRRWTRTDASSGRSMLDDIGLSQGQLRQVLELLAYQLHSEGTAGDSTGDDAEFTGGRLLDIVEQLRLRRVDIWALRDALAQRAGVTYERAPNRYQFAHRSFQEHLAACYLCGDGRYPALPARHLRQQPGLWRNVFDLLPDEARRQGRDLWALVKALLPDKQAALPTAPDDPSWYSLYHAVHLMTQHLPADDDLQAVYRPRLTAWLPRLIELGALAPVDRAAMGRVLSEIGDPRPGVGVIVRDGVTIPDIQWCEVPAGPFLMGSDKAKDPHARDDETPQRAVDIPYTYWMAKYPVTNAQYAPFVAGDGYTNRAYWTEAGWETKEQKKWTQPRVWDDPTWTLANHPVVGVSWYEAVAYAAWLDARYRALGLSVGTPPGVSDGGMAMTADMAVDTAGRVPAGYVIRLPTETEWEKAARGTDGRIYPYGDVFDPQRANVHETGIERTSAVGLFLGDDLPYGLGDMSGNVWEWCQTVWRSSYADGVEDNSPVSNTRRVLRGGSFRYNQDFARAAYRNYFIPNDRGNDNGCRLVCVRAPSR